MRQALAELTPLVTAKHLRVVLRVNDLPPEDGYQVMAMAERFLCHSMFSNLCKNAVEASRPEEVINIGFQWGTKVAISIDNCGEVPEAIRDRFFDKFVTAGKRTGTGLGTYSAKLSALTQGGAISLDSSVVGRTCIRIVLPETGAI